MGRVLVPAAVLTLLTVVLAVVSALCASGLIRRNHLAGIRFPVLLASDRAWRVGHRAAVLPSGVFGAIAAALLILGAVVPATEVWSHLLTIVVAVAGFVWAITAAVRAASAA